MSCCGHSHSNPEDKSCGTKKCCGKGGKLLCLLVVFVIGVVVGRCVDFPLPAAPESTTEAMNHEGHDMKDMPKNIYDSAMKDMHEDMMKVETTGNADVDFVKGMIPHHQGAIDMAKIVERKGADPEIKKLAEGIIDAQKKEIADMKAWLKTAEAKLKEEAKAAEKKAAEEKAAEEAKKAEFEKQQAEDAAAKEDAAKSTDVDSDGDAK